MVDMRGLARRILPLILLFVAGCSLAPLTRPAGELPPVGGPSQVGIASWYGPGFHGRPTASGVVYDQHELTAAHQTLPLGTRLIVTNLQNGSSTEVTVNDRGPFAKGRIVDLSYAAARTLGMIGPGTAPVRLDVIQNGLERITRIPEHLIYTLQAGSFADLGNARKLKERLRQVDPSLPPADIVSLEIKEATVHRVRVGSYADRREAERHAQLLARRGFSVVIVEK
jgi:rare lipoprotein A